MENKLNKLEQLLNSLIQKGWQPTNKAKRGDVYKCEVRGLPGWINAYFFIKGEGSGGYSIYLRELTSKDTGLRQFVCENGMIKSNGYCNGWAYHNSYDEYDEGDGMYDEGELPRYYDTDYQYRVIESSLRDESELESFILDNIKVGNEQL